MTLTMNLTFPAGDLSVSVPVSTMNDTVLEGTETFSASLSDPTGDLQLGTRSTATVRIIDDDGMDLPVFKSFF